MTRGEYMRMARNSAMLSVAQLYVGHKAMVKNHA